MHQTDHETHAAWRSMPRALRGTAAWAGAALLVGAVVYLVVQFAVAVGALVLALFAALLFTALFRPVADWLDRKGVPRLLATWIVLVAALVVLGGLLFFIEQQLVAQLPALRESLAGGLDRVRNVLVERLGLPPGPTEDSIAALQRQLDGMSGGSPVVTAARTLLTVLAGFALAVFTAFWLVYDGERVWAFVARLFPDRWSARTSAAGEAAWQTVGGYLRGVTLVALMDAVGIGAALLVLGVPLPFTLALLTFLGAYIPIVGAALAGLAAVLVAFAAKGATTALLTLAAVIAVQQLEGNVLQPLIMGRTLKLHPLAIAWALSIGGLLYGIPGAILSVPLAAAVYAVGTVLAGWSLPEEQPWRVRLRRRSTGSDTSARIRRSGGTASAGDLDGDDSNSGGLQTTGEPIGR